MSNFKSKMVKLGLAMSLLVVMVLSATMMLPHNSNFTQVRAAQQNGEIERVVSAQHETVSVPQQEARRNIPAYARCSIFGNFVAEDYTILDTTRIDENFADDRILLVMSKRESRNFRDYSVSDFPEVRLSSVECLTPGLDIARNKLKASVSSRASSFYFDSDWTVDLEYFRRILMLRLAQPSKYNVLSAIRLLEQRPDVHNASPDIPYQIEPIMFLDDEGYYHYSMTGIEPMATNTGLWHLNRINIAQAHGITTGSTNVRVGLLSTGVDVGHADLTGRVYTRLSQNFLAGGSALQDTHGHGTNIAGVIVGRTTGVAPNSRLVSLRVADNAGYWPGATATAIQTITNAGNLNANDRIQILSLSSVPHRNNVAVRNAIRAFPGLFVGSAGNDNRNADTHYPLIRTDRLNNQIVVGASDSGDRRSSFSNFGTQTVCLFAPGSSITTTRPGGGTTSVNGTSFSAPMVIGA